MFGLSFTWLPRQLRRYTGMVIVLLCLGLASTQVGCTGDPCQKFFRELKQRCQLGSSAEGVKLDQFLNQQFRPCQLDLCDRTSINTISCTNPDTHVPGGYNGRFFTCE